MENLRLSPLITEQEIQARVRKMGDVLTTQFAGKDLTVICVLKGSFMFFADLTRAINTDLTCDFIGVSSYSGAHSTGDVRMTMDLTKPVAGRHVILVEDIVDTGLTMNFLKRYIEARKPASLVTATLLMKPDALKEKCEVDHVGFKIPNDFVVGYGLDYQNYFRNLPYIAQVSNIN